MSKGASILLALVLLFTFPLWIGLIAGGFGLLMGIFGALFGIISGIFGALFGILGGLFTWEWPGMHLVFPHFHLNGFTTAVLIIVIALLIAKGRAGNK